MFRLRDRQYSGSRRWLETALRDSGASDKPGENVGSSESKKREVGESNPLWLSDELEFWPDKVIIFFIFQSCHWRIKSNYFFASGHYCNYFNKNNC